MSLDHAIDVAAREMTALDAPAGMRAAVMTRIEGGRERTEAGPPRWAWAAGAAVVVLAVTAALWIVRSGDRPQSVSTKHDTPLIPAGSATQSQPQRSGTLVSAGLVTGARPGGQADGGVARAARAVTDAQFDQNRTATPEIGPAAIAQPDPIALAPLGPDAIHIPEIGVEPLGDLKPLTIQNIPVGSTEIQSPSIR